MKLIGNRCDSVPGSTIREFFALQAEVDDVVSFCLGEPDFTAPRHVIDAVIESFDRGETHYTPNSGLPRLKEDIVKKFAMRGLDYTTDEVMVAMGGTMILFLACNAILDQGDEVILQNPGYPNNIGIIRQVGGVPAFVQVYEENGFMYDIEDVKAAITGKTKILLVNSPSNPTGGVATRENLEQLAQIAIDNDLFVISDELYNELVWSEEPYTSIASLPGMKERTLIVDGFSKTYAMTGLRLGYGAGPAELIRNMTKLIENVASCVNEGIQYGGIAALEGDQQCVQDMRAEYIKRRRLVIDGLNSIDGISCVEPKGAFYAFANIKKTGLSSREFAIRLLREGHVAVVPGYGFGTGGEGFVRLSYATSEENIKEGLRRIQEFVSKLNAE